MSEQKDEITMILKYQEYQFLANNMSTMENVIGSTKMEIRRLEKAYKLDQLPEMRKFLARVEHDYMNLQKAIGVTGWEILAHLEQKHNFKMQFMVQNPPAADEPEKPKLTLV